MAGGDSTWRLSTSLASRLGSHVSVVEEIAAQLESFGWCEKDAFGIHLALEESLTNAVRHGNKEDEQKSVHIECEISATRFWAHIRDEGQGFRPCDVPDPTHEENLTAIGGRGLLLIKTYMTDVVYNSSGNCVTLLKLRQAE
jgi:serine/threonine-protein kinase RsbW